MLEARQYIVDLGYVFEVIGVGDDGSGGAQVEASVRSCALGVSSAVHALTIERDSATKRLVLRRFVRTDWVAREPDIAKREAAALRLLDRRNIPAPRLLAVDEDGSASGVPSLLMTRLPGRTVLAPADEDSWLRQMADLYRSTGQWQTLAQVLGRLVDITTEPADKAGVFVQMGELAEQQLGLKDQARSYYKQALEVSPGDSVAMCRMASSLYAQGNYQESVDALRKVIATKPMSHCAYFTLGVAFADAGIYKEAVRMWQKVIKLAPESAEATSAKESIDILSRFIGQ